MRTLLFLLILAVLAATGFFAYQYFSAPRTFEDGSIGRVDREESLLEICISGEGKCEAANAADTFFIDNVLRTNETGLMRAFLVDETELTIGPNAELVIDDYVYQPRTLGTFAISLVKGTLRVLSGNVGKTAEKDLNIETPVGNIGIRGTDFWIRLLDERLEVVLIDGEVEITNEAGAVTLRNKGDYALIAGPNIAPQLRTDLSHGEIFELLSSTAFDDEIAALLDPANGFRTDGGE